MRNRRCIACTVVVLALLAVAASAAAGVRGTELVIPSVARGPGAGGSFWSTAVWLFNPGTAPMEAEVALLERGRSNPDPISAVVLISAGQTVAFTDLLDQLFGLEQGAGALRVRADSALLASARVFNSSGDVAESQGQLLAGLPVSAALAAGEGTDIIGVSHGPGAPFRCNVGLVETVGGEVEVEVQAVSPGGAVLARTSYSLGPWEALQRPLTDLGADLEIAGGRVRLEVRSGGGRVLGFASVVGNGVLVQDPTTLEMELPWTPTELPAGVGSVTAGAGLTGGGTGDVRLDVGPGPGLEVTADGVGIAPGGVSREMLRSDSVVTGLVVGDQTLRDDIVLEGGEGVYAVVEGNRLRLELVPSTGGGAPEQLELEVTSDDGAWTTVRAVGVPYETADGAWRMTFNIAGRAWSPREQITLLVSGVTFEATDFNEQPVSVFTGSGSSVAVARTVPKTSEIAIGIAVGSAKTRFHLAGDVELANRPEILD